jgi:hypothetical protein
MYCHLVYVMFLPHFKKFLNDFMQAFLTILMCMEIKGIIFTNCKNVYKIAE